jgi:hypothetical protein
MPKIGEKMRRKLLMGVADWKGNSSKLLPMSLAAAVPLWISQFSELSAEERLARVRGLETADDFCLSMEHVLHKGPKPGDSARAFNNLAKAIALMAFCPGGVTLFGRHHEVKRVREGSPGMPLEEEVESSKP